MDPLPGSPPADLKLRLSRASSTDPSRKPGEAGVLFPETGQQVSELRQFHLDLAFPAQGMLGKNIEDQLGTIDDAHLRKTGNGAGLTARQILIEDNQVGTALQGRDDQFLEFALSHNEAGMDVGPALDDLVEYLDPGGFGQLLQLDEGFLRFCTVPGGDADEDGLVSLF